MSVGFFRKIGVTGAALLIALACIVMMGAFILGERRDDRARDRQVELIIEARTEARRVTCEKDKKFALAHNKGFTDDAASDNEFLDFLATAGGTREPDPKYVPILDAQKAANLQNLAENLVEVPDCSPEAIAEFYDGDDQPTAP